MRSPSSVELRSAHLLHRSPMIRCLTLSRNPFSSAILHQVTRQKIVKTVHGRTLAYKEPCGNLYKTSDCIDLRQSAPPTTARKPAGHYFYHKCYFTRLCTWRGPASMRSSTQVRTAVACGSVILREGVLLRKSAVYVSWQISPNRRTANLRKI